MQRFGARRRRSSRISQKGGVRGKCTKRMKYENGRAKGLPTCGAFCCCCHCCWFLFVIALLRAEKRQRVLGAKERGRSAVEQPKIANPVGPLKLTSMNTLWVNNRKTIQRKSLVALWAFWPASQCTRKNGSATS